MTYKNLYYVESNPITRAVTEQNFGFFGYDVRVGLPDSVKEHQNIERFSDTHQFLQKAGMSDVILLNRESMAPLDTEFDNVLDVYLQSLKDSEYRGDVYVTTHNEPRDTSRNMAFHLQYKVLKYPVGPLDIQNW
ncbi:hypothetical protein HOL21_00165 [Candidatus Woesearchaeota archaeon]|jgi:hypothetical protein|nr:hypothetical protein [Candidatus Woesearchaeota archaeon]MBT5396613.1 hypothetical protein [Candidatus Woesearchaeota archaeon]MBT5924917.1 hypothetical protein [Candidatus Woesearchaeota archaeon]MBT6367600.1 hypothetical protein [Candidatus Woesearchaeota archaeon]MBT7763099.1 hypothetical protein [Candidatus Woesearchaeota archaeon]